MFWPSSKVTYLYTTGMICVKKTRAEYLKLGPFTKIFRFFIVLL
jgi:hypothetical protein